jgi:ribonuclease P protein component
VNGEKEYSKLVSIKENKDFKKLYNKGKSFVGKNCIVYSIPNNSSYNRFGYTASKKIGSAVERNLARRKVREICRLNQHELKQGFDIVIVIRTRAIKTETKFLIKELLYLFNKVGLLC